MTQAFVTLIRRLLGLKDLLEEEVQQTTDEVLKEQLDLSVTQIMNADIDKLIDVISKKKGIHKSNVDLFAEILVINANSRELAEERIDLYNKALKLYEWLEKSSDTYSIERHRKMNEVRNLIENIHK